MVTKPPVPTSAVDPNFAEAHRSLLADSAIQFDLRPYRPPELPEWLRHLGEFIAADHPVLRILLWGLAAIFVLAILWGLARRLTGARWPWRRHDKSNDLLAPPEGASARQLLAEADALAAEGAYSQAAHLLLFRSIEEIDRQRPDLLGPALTSRNIAALPQIPERPRGDFARIAAWVERSLFARRPLGCEEWTDCRQAYEAFTLAEGWRA